SDEGPSISFDRLINALKRDGWVVVRQRGSHIRLQKRLPDELAEAYRAGTQADQAVVTLPHPQAGEPLPGAVTEAALSYPTRSNQASSSMTSMPNSLACLSLEPAPGPATTRSVFF